MTIRYEPDTKLLFVAVRPYREECSKYSMSFDGSLEPYIKAGSYQGQKKKRMLAGTVASTAQNVYALVFDASKLGFFDEEILLNAPPPEPISMD